MKGMLYEKKRAMKAKKGNNLTVVLFTTYVLVLIGVILFKLPFRQTDSERVVNLIPFMGSFTEEGAFRFAEVIENILIFVPFGMYICMIKSNWPHRKKILAIIGVTVAFEITQYIFALGRTDITDVLGNTLGGAIGIGMYGLLNKLLENRTDKIINITSLVLTVCVLWFFAFLFFRIRLTLR